MDYETSPEIMEIVKEMATPARSAYEILEDPTEDEVIKTAVRLYGALGNEARDLLWDGERFELYYKPIGWWVKDEGAEEHFPRAQSADEALDDFFLHGSWGAGERPYKAKAYAFRYVWDHDAGEFHKEDVTPGCHFVEADEPQCSASEHAWASPVEVVGGLKENPGVFGHGGGVRIREVCRHCGAYRITDTWYQDPTDGSVWDDDAVWYEDADEVSLDWVHRENSGSDQED